MIMNASARKLPQLTAAAIGCCALLGASATHAQVTATTDPVGFITLNVAGTGGGGGTSAISFTGLGMTRPVEYQGSAEAVGAKTLTDNQAAWTDNQFNGVPHYVEIVSGPAAGTTYDVTATDAASKTITLAQNLAAGVAADVSFKVRKHWTIATVFGASNEAGLQAGDAATADLILIFNGTAYDRYFYQTGTGWQNANSPGPDAGSTVIYPEEGVLLSRKQAGPVNVALMGAVKMGQTSVPIFTGINIVGNVYAAPMTLDSSKLYTGDPATGLASGDATTADQVRIYNSETGGYDVYYYQEGGFGSGWRNAVKPTVDAKSTPIPVGVSVVIKRNGANFNWTAPQHPASL